MLVCVCVRLPPVQWSGLIVRFLVSAPVTCAVYQSDGWILGLCTCHPCSTRSRVRFCVYCHFTKSMPPLSSRFFKPTPSWWFDISLQALRSSFAVVVFRLVRLRTAPFSVSCCPSYFCFGLRCACLSRFWLCVKFSVVTCCCLRIRFADQSFPPLSLLFFAPTMSWCFNMTLQDFAVMLCWVVFTPACPEIVLFALPCCLSYICLGARCAWSNRVCGEFSVVRFFRLPTSFADPVSAMIGIGRQFPLCTNISKKDTSKTHNKRLKHLKGTDRTS